LKDGSELAEVTTRHYCVDCSQVSAGAHGQLCCTQWLYGSDCAVCTQQQFAYCLAAVL